MAINPQAVNEITIGNYPRKVDEYLAAGRPVVATRTLAMAPFADYVYLADNVDDYDRLIRQAIKEDIPAKGNARRQFAAQHTWKNNVDEILKAVDLVVTERMRQ